MAEALPEETINKALRFAFGAGEHPWYTAEREVRGAKVLFRALTDLELTKCDEAADVLSSPVGQARERQTHWLARSVVAVDGQELPDSIAWRLAHFHEMPGAYKKLVVDAYLEVQAEYESLLAEDALKN